MSNGSLLQALCPSSSLTRERQSSHNKKRETSSIQAKPPRVQPVTSSSNCGVNELSAFVFGIVVYVTRVDYHNLENKTQTEILSLSLTKVMHDVAKSQ